MGVPHVRRAEMGQYRAVHIGDQAMYDRLGMDQELDPLGGQSEQVMASISSSPCSSSSPNRPKFSPHGPIGMLDRLAGCRFHLGQT